MTLITSPQNQAIKLIRALRSRKERDRTGLFVVEGIRPVREALTLGAAVESLIVAPALLTSEAAVAAVRRYARASGRVLRVTPEVFRSLSARDNPHGLAAVIRQNWRSLDTCVADDALWVALEGVQDPGNLGCILRTCDAAGADGVILLGEATDPYHPAAVRASMGAVFSQQLVRADHQAFAAWVERVGISVIGTSGTAAVDYRTLIYRAPLVLLMGAERSGLSPSLQRCCETLVRIPMVGRADSLNLAVATALML